METRFRSGSLLVISVICLALFAGTGIVGAQNQRPKNVQVAVRAKWSGTPLLLEAGYSFIFFLFQFLSSYRSAFFCVFHFKGVSVLSIVVLVFLLVPV